MVAETRKGRMACGISLRLISLLLSVAESQATAQTATYCAHGTANPQTYGCNCNTAGGYRIQPGLWNCFCDWSIPCNGGEFLYHDQDKNCACACSIDESDVWYANFYCKWTGGLGYDRATCGCSCAGPKVRQNGRCVCPVDQACLVAGKETNTATCNCQCPSAAAFVCTSSGGSVDSNSCTCSCPAQKSLSNGACV